MSRRSVVLGTLAVAFVALACLSPLPTASAQTLDELRERFAERYPELVKAKREGVIGETWSGGVAVVRDADEERQKLVREENADRKRLYEIIAEREDTTPELVGRRNARRNFQRAEEGDYLRDENGNWYRKGETPPGEQ